MPCRVAVAVALVASVSGCAKSYTSFGYDVTRSTSGTVAAAVAGGESRSGRVAIGFTSGTTSMEVVMNGQDLEMGSDAWIAGSAGLELSLRPLRVGPVQSVVHFGPMRGLLIDASTLDVTWGAGLAYGAGLIVGHGGVNILIDARGEEQYFAGMEGSATGGACSVKAVSVGLHFGR